MATCESITPTIRSIGTAIEQLFDVAALIECTESQMESDGGNPAVRVLRIAYDRIQESIKYLDAIDSEAA